MSAVVEAVEALNQVAIYKAALERIVRATNEWEANHLGGVHIQRKRWKRCGEIASQALSSAQQNAHLTPESLATSQAVVNASALSKSDGDTSPAQAQVA